MMRRQIITAALGLAALPAVAFPVQPVTVVVPYPPGGPTDAMARALADLLRGRLGQPVVVENRPGGGGQIAGTAVLRRPPDGHSLLVADTTTLAINPHIYRNFAYDPATGITPIAPLLRMPHALFVPAASPFRSFADLRAAARSQPLSFASQGYGTVGHLLGEMLRQGTGGLLNHIPYQGSAPAMTALLGRQVDLLFDGVGPGLQHVRGGGLRALAVAGAERVTVLPDTPTAAEGGHPELSLAMWFGVVAPAGLPAGVLQQLHDGIAWSTEQPQFGDRFLPMGFEPMAMSSDDFRAFIAAETKRFAVLTKENNITVQ
ncbi:Bug family tripartite tricarboxylate transporter substrate binding protein [Pseudoroseomonas sp. WGS1072]|uniref:Bug family tripartite tricarboxylate transporter substrate binding protein n=1 Tax=Roseomonas sp. WGS1072 TaxID=3366816 RepID=UPI003BF072F4